MVLRNDGQSPKASVAHLGCQQPLVGQPTVNSLDGRVPDNRIQKRMDGVAAFGTLMSAMSLNLLRVLKPYLLGLLLPLLARTLLFCLKPIPPFIMYLDEVSVRYVQED